MFRIVYKEMKDSDKEKDSGKMVRTILTFRCLQIFAPKQLESYAKLILLHTL